MPTYNCEIKQGSITIFSSETTAVSDKKACANTWWKYSKSEVRAPRFPIFMSQMKKQGYICSCAEQEPEPEYNEYDEMPEFIDQEPKRQQLDLPFSDKLDDAFGI